MLSILSLKRVSESSWDSFQVQTLDLQKVSKKSEHTDRNIEFFVAIVLSTALKIITCCFRRARFQNLTLCIVLFQIPDNSLMALVPKETLHTSINEATSGNSTKCQPRAFYLIFCFPTVFITRFYYSLICLQLFTFIYFFFYLHALFSLQYLYGFSRPNK